MGKPIIEVRNIGKKYNITHMKGGYIALRDVLANIFKNPFSFIKNKAKRAIGLEKKEDFWALKNISFDVNKGEVVGIIGANGAGKSTLLKILSQITPPTEGEIILRGKVGSLLEVGTGFHPELTGRENIFLNGAILGMKKKEIAKKFDEIVKFAGIEKFLDTPVKYYSSGMYVRLAFSVAAHMEPDILIIDEVLAVGDAEFQKKCLGKMDEITRREGRTILFVSHNLGAIKQLCKRVVVLKNGEVVFEGETEKAIEFYIKNQNTNPITDLTKDYNRKGDGSIRLTKFHIEDEQGIITRTLKNSSSGSLVFSYSCKDPKNIKNIDIGFSLEKNATLVNVMYSSFTKENINIKEIGQIKFDMYKLPLAPGIYNIGVRVLISGIEADWPHGSVASFEVLPSDEYIAKGYKSDQNSVVLIDGRWS
jgi:lipopolysaccharide transport system ATP-binding protein